MTESNSDLPTFLKSPVAVVCYDAGAANLIFAWLREWANLGLLDKHEIWLVLQGPAEVAWHTQEIVLPRVQLHSEINSVLSNVNCVLTGTGWGSSLEHDARLLAQLNQTPCIAVIDHWTNFQQRFERNGHVVLPDVIWVADSYAADLAKELFKTIRVDVLPNVYLNEMVKAIPPVAAESQTLLYVLEPLRTTWGREKEGEFQALDYFVQNKQLIIGTQQVNIILRPHPSEDAKKYKNWILENANLNLKLDTFLTLNESIANAKWVVGAETFALLIAVAAKRITWSSLPPWAHRLRLPQSSIKQMRDYEKMNY